MTKPVSYNPDQHTTPNVMQEPPATLMQSFSSQEEAELYRLEKNLSMSDMEKFRLFCRLMRIGKMLTPRNTYLPDK